jgi:hypothetical protein
MTVLAPDRIGDLLISEEEASSLMVMTGITNPRSGYVGKIISGEGPLPISNLF